MRRRELDLKKIFLRGCIAGVKDRVPYPGTLEEFVAWTGAPSARALETMGLQELENLPGIKGVLRPLGGSHYILGRVRFTWDVIPRDYPGPLRFERFVGMGTNYMEAALWGLLTAWELMTRRKKGQRRDAI